jgi:hypothetical protein
LVPAVPVAVTVNVCVPSGVVVVLELPPQAVHPQISIAATSVRKAALCRFFPPTKTSPKTPAPIRPAQTGDHRFFPGSLGGNNEELVVVFTVRVAVASSPEEFGVTLMGLKLHDVAVGKLLHSKLTVPL